MSGTFFFTADLHFGHRLVSEIRKFDTISEHDEALIEAFNSRVRPGDNTFILGDVMLPFEEDRMKKILRKLNGSKHLIFGNHDPARKHEALGKGGWAWTGHIRARKIAGQSFFLCHYACRSWPGMGRGAIHLYGHSHGNLAPGYGKSMDVGVDTRADFSPWQIDEVMELMDPVPILVVDHHDAREDVGEDIPF